MITGTNGDVLDAYAGACGYVLGDSSTDQGGNEQDVLTWWYQNGILLPDGSRSKLAAPPIEIDVRNDADISEAITECGGVYTGFEVPDYILPEDGSPPPKVWDFKPGQSYRIIGGHCVPFGGSDSKYNYNVRSWGEDDYIVTKAFKDQFFDEIYALADESWIGATGQTPLGLTLAQLEQLEHGLA
jgi:hypothetical protein